MMRIFVSSQAVDRDPARTLIGALRERGVDVECSPSNPLDREDDRWADWYRAGLPAAVGRCDVFVIVIDIGWDSSTWMMAESDAGLALERRGGQLLFWNPECRSPIAAGMRGYLKRELPGDLGSAVQALLS